MKRAWSVLILFLLLGGLLGPSVGAQGPTPSSSDPWGVAPGTVPPGQQTTDRHVWVGATLPDTLPSAGVVAHAGGALASWELKAASPVASFDSAVVGAVHDGGLWSIGGWSGGATQRYDPATDTWSTHATEPEPRIESPVDGCYGLNLNGDEIVVIFPSTVGAVVDLHVYNISDDAWYTPPVPAPFPANGQWAHDIVSLYGITGENVCYISGGADNPSDGGNLTDLWEYHPYDNTILHLGNFTHIPAGFNHHASWYVPWLGSKGAICVGGGVDSTETAYDDTQCYYIAEANFGCPNCDLGPLPEPWWGMADGWKYDGGRYQIWIADGMDASINLLQASAYLDPATFGFVYGPVPAVALYRMEGDSLFSEFYVEQGGNAPFSPTSYNQHLLQAPRPPCDTEVVASDDFEGQGLSWSLTGLWITQTQTDTCGAMVAPFPSPNHALYYGQADVCTYDTGAPTAGTATWYRLDLTYYVSATLTFWSYEQTECSAPGGPGGNCSWDLRLVDVSTDAGATWNTVWGSNGPENTWYQATANLSPYAGQVIRLRFRFDSVDSNFNSFFGWMVDDVAVLGCRSCELRWHSETPIPGPREDAAVLAYRDSLYVLGGNGSGGTSYVYSIGWNQWAPIAPMSPEIEFPVDGAIGETPDGPRAFILDDLSSGVSGAMIYDLNTDIWIHDTTFPVNGRWAPDMAADPEHNLIFISGGATTPGVGDLKEFWVYDPWNDTAAQKDDFTTARDFHASWYVPWLGQGYLCIGGGVNSTGELTSTQCYDMAAEAWRPENADLGSLPATWAAMGDAVKVHDGCPQLWITGGMVSATMSAQTAYFDLCDKQWHMGAEMQYPTYRAEAAAVPFLGEVYQVGGYGEGGVQPYTQHHLQPCPQTGLLEGTVTDHETGCGDATCTTARVLAWSWAERRDYGIAVDAAGQYSATLPVGAYSVTAWAPGYASGGPFDADIVDAVTTTQDFCLPRPLAGAAPAVLTATSYFSIPVTLPLTVSNGGGVTMVYALVEIPPTVTLPLYAAAGTRPTGQETGPYGDGEALLPGGLTGAAPSDSATAPAGYTPVPARSTPQGAHPEYWTACVFKDADPWGFTAVEDLLSAFGIPYEVHTSADFATLDFSQCGMIVFSGDQPQTFYDAYALNVAKFEQYATDGGFLNFFSCDHGWNLGLLGAPLPGGMQWNTDVLEDYNVIDDLAHPVVQGVPSPFYGSYASHGVFTNLPAGAHIIAHAQTDGRPTIVEYPMGAGWLIAFGQPLEYGYGFRQDTGLILQNTLQWGYHYLPAGDLPWVSESPISGTLPATQTQAVDVTFHCTATDGIGLLTGTLVILHNDPCIPPLKVSLAFECLGQCQPATPDFTWTPADPVAGKPITFTATASGSLPITFAWDFGDGGSGSGSSVAHTYATADTYQVILTATNPCGDVPLTREVVVGSPLSYVYLPLVLRHYP